MTLTFNPGNNTFQGMHSHILVHVPTKFDQNPISGLGATVVHEWTDRQADKQIHDKPRSPSQSVPSLELGTQTRKRNDTTTKTTTTTTTTTPSMLQT